MYRLARTDFLILHTLPKKYSRALFKTADLNKVDCMYVRMVVRKSAYCKYSSKSFHVDPIWARTWYNVPVCEMQNRRTTLTLGISIMYRLYIHSCKKYDILIECRICIMLIHRKWYDRWRTYCWIHKLWSTCVPVLATLRSTKSNHYLGGIQ